MSVDVSQLRIGDPVTIHARITDFMAPHYPYPVVVRLGRAGSRRRGFVVVAYNDIVALDPLGPADAASFIRPHPEEPAQVGSTRLAHQMPISGRPEIEASVSKDEGAAAIQAATDAALRSAAEACRVRASHHALAAFDLDAATARDARMKMAEALRCADVILALARAADSEPCAESAS